MNVLFGKSEGKAGKSTNILPEASIETDTIVMILLWYATREFMGTRKVSSNSKSFMIQHTQSSVLATHLRRLNKSEPQS